MEPLASSPVLPAIAAEAQLSAGNTLFGQGRLVEAARCYERALFLHPNHPEVLNNLGVTFAERGQHEEAIGWYERALAANAQYAEAWFNRGNAQRELLRCEAACDSYAWALELQPKWPAALTNLGLAQARLGRVERAAVCYERALRLRPDHALALNGLALVRQAQWRLDEALALFDRAILVDPAFAHPHVNRAQVWLLQGRFPEGWDEYEWRWRLPRSGRPEGLRVWNGESLAGRTILLWKEQGVGDTLQFVRYATLVKQRGARVILRAPASLHPLLSTCPGIDELTDEGSRTSVAADFHCPLLSLPRLFDTTLDSVPNTVPYLHADAGRIARWRQRLSNLGGFRVGIAWQGSRGYPEDCLRSIPLTAFRPLADVPGIRLVSLQKGFGREQLSASDLPFAVTELGPDWDEGEGAFLDTAAILHSLDLVVTADTSLGHLAGALGIPVWIALPLVSDWRWMLDRTDSPWYPSVRLFRQTKLGDFSSVFEQMASHL
jgi:Flp pilus assembly protein TadD